MHELFFPSDPKRQEMINLLLAMSPETVFRSRERWIRKQEAIRAKDLQALRSIVAEERKELDTLLSLI